MKTTKKRHVPGYTENVSVITCDKCGEPAGADVKAGERETESTVISTEARYDEKYEHSGEAETVEVDCCAKCFRAHVLPALEALGFKPRTEKRDW